MAQATWDRMVIALQKEGYVHCKDCGKEAHLGDAVEDEWHRMGPLPLSFDPLKAAPSAFWICPKCATTESTTATAASASQLAPTTATTTDTAESASEEEVQQVRAELEATMPAIAAGPQGTRLPSLPAVPATVPERGRPPRQSWQHGPPVVLVQERPRMDPSAAKPSGGATQGAADAEADDGMVPAPQRTEAGMDRRSGGDHHAEYGDQPS